MITTFITKHIEEDNCYYNVLIPTVLHNITHNGLSSLDESLISIDH